MKLFNQIKDAFVFLAEAVYRIFSPHDDMYPETGVQPFSGVPYSKRDDWW